MDSNNMTMLLLFGGILLICLNNGDKMPEMDDNSQNNSNMIVGLLFLGVLFMFMKPRCNPLVQPFSNIVHNSESYSCIPETLNFKGTNDVGVPLSNVGDCKDPETQITPLKTTQEMC